MRKDWLSLVVAGDAGPLSTFSVRTCLTNPLRWSPRGKDDLDDGAATLARCPGRTLWQLLWERIDRLSQYGSLWWLRLDGKTQVTIEYVRAVGTVDPRVRCVRDLAAFCGIFRTPSIWTSSASDADAGSHPKCQTSELGAVVRRAWIGHARS